MLRSKFESFCKEEIETLSGRGKVQTHLINQSTTKCTWMSIKIIIVNNNKLVLIKINTLLLLNKYILWTLLSAHFKYLFVSAAKYIKITEPRTREDFLHCKCYK